MNIKDSLHLVKRSFNYFLIFFPFIIFIKLWDTWRCFLSGGTIDWVKALGELNYFAIIAITLPLAILVGNRKARKNMV